MAGSSRSMFSSVVLMASVMAAMIATSSVKTVAAAADDCSLSKDMLTKCVDLNDAMRNGKNPFPFLDCCSELNKNGGRCLCDIVSAVEKEVGSAISPRFCFREPEVMACTSKTCSFSAGQMEKQVIDCLKTSESLHLQTPLHCCGPAGDFGPGCICEFEKMIRAKGSSLNTELACGLKRPSGGCPN